MTPYLRRFSSLLLAASAACAFPPSMDIGTFTIDNYSANGGGMSNLTYQIASGQHFFAGANAYVPEYCAATGGGTGGPNQALDLRDTQVSKNAITSTSPAPGSREFCDFVFYGGHGLGGGLFLGDGGAYGSVLPGDLSLGAGFTRWFVAASCLVFNAGVPADTWAGAFQGLKAMLGFESVIFDNNLAWQLYNDFWLNWTWREKNLVNAFFDAQTNYGYSHMYPALGLKPGCLSAEVPGTRNDYCHEAFKDTEKNYDKAIANSGHYYKRIIGNPIY